MNNIKSNSYTEKEKQELFNKLKKASKLFGLKISIEEDRRSNNSGATIDTQTISMGLKWDDSNSKKFGMLETNEAICDNIDNYHKQFPYEDFIKYPFLIKVFMHEVAHLLTVSMDDIALYKKEVSELASSKDMNSQEKQLAYRKVSFEKLADNLAYELIYQNYDMIIKILLGKRTRITKSRISKNTKIAKEFRAKYIEEVA